MQYEVVVPIPVRSVWETFHDAERLGRCIPGLTPEEPVRGGTEGVVLTGRWRVRVDADTVAFRGLLRLAAAAEPLALIATVVGVEEPGAAGGEGLPAARLDAEFTVRLYDLAAAEDDDAEHAGETRIVFAAEPGEFGPVEAARQAAFARAADLFAAALADELAPETAADTPFEPVRPLAEPFSTPPPRTRPVPPRPAEAGSEADLWSEVGHGSGRAARRAIRVLVPALGAVVLWRLVRVRARRERVGRA
ncbi:hypothetical protein ACFRCG_10765 [Embleya sp. NPDC056575]|uniref:hypothetical protein n=1 Tax=unclassified Embleya TaxID=2699296 RepID=UPI0036C2B32B